MIRGKKTNQLPLLSFSKVYQKGRRRKSEADSYGRRRRERISIKKRTLTTESSGSYYDQLRDALRREISA